MRTLFRYLTITALGALPLNAVCQTDATASEGLAKPPALSPAANSYVRKAVESCNAMLASGQFETVRSIVASCMPLKETPVFVKLQIVPIPLREGYRQAVTNAISLWNKAVADVTRFVETNDEAKARLIVQFESVVVNDAGTVNFGQAFPNLICSGRVNPPVTVETGGKPLHSISRVAIYVQGTADPHSPQSVTHLVAKELGAYLGLNETIKSDEVMGPDMHGAAETAAIAPAEVVAVKEIAATTVALVNLANRKVRVEQSIAKVQLDRDTIDGGTVTRGSTVPYVFSIKNVGNIPLEINAKSNCGCTVAEYDRLIQPGQSGKLTANLNTTGFLGPIHKTVTITTNDPKNALFNLNLACTVVPIVRVLPDSPVTVVVNDTGITTQRFFVYAKEGESLAVQNVASPSPNITTKVSPWKGPLEDRLAGEPAKERTGYAIDVNITADQPVGRNFQALTLSTGNSKEPSAMIQLILEKGIVFQPQAVYMGVVDPQPAQQVDRIITVSKKGGLFKIVKVEPDDPNIITQLTTVTEGKEYRITISYKGGWASGFINKKVVITTDDPKQTSLIVPVQASVRAAAAGTNANAP